jgi:hypothetical protein
MLGESSRGGAQPSISSVEQTFGRARRESKFGTIVRALWPVKPALNLAQRIGCSERAAQYYIDGERKPSAEAMLVVLRYVIE